MRRKGARLGQHFLTGVWAARELALAAATENAEVILEIGPGKGALTRELLATGARVIAIEKDTVLVDLLSEVFAPEIAEGTLTLISDDIRNVDPEKIGLKSGMYVLAANIPYYITGEIIRQFLTTASQPKALFLLIQKEVAQRITSDRESILSLSVKAYGVPKVLKKVSKGNFSPPPSVDSAILAIKNVSRSFFGSIDEELFFKIVRTGFSSKRKFLLSNLSGVFPKSDVEKAFSTCGIDAKARAETLALSTWKDLTRALG